MTPGDVETRAMEVVDELRGTCKSLHDVMDCEEQEDQRILQTIDDNLFCCNTCEWWCGFDEESNEEGVCDDCCDD